MTWLGTISRLVTPRLAAGYHRLRAWEANGRVYELVGVRIVKWILRRGPLAVFNPHLHLPRDRTHEELARLDQRRRDAEASHAILLVITLAVVAYDGARGWWPAAAALRPAAVGPGGRCRSVQAAAQTCGSTEAQISATFGAALSVATPAARNPGSAWRTTRPATTIRGATPRWASSCCSIAAR